MSRRHRAKLSKSAVTQTGMEAPGAPLRRPARMRHKAASRRACFASRHSSLLRNMSSNRFNICRAVYRTLRALARDQTHFHILIDIERN